MLKEYLIGRLGEAPRAEPALPPARGESRGVWGVVGFRVRGVACLAASACSESVSLVDSLARRMCCPAREDTPMHAAWACGKALRFVLPRCRRRAGRAWRSWWR